MSELRRSCETAAYGWSSRFLGAVMEFERSAMVVQRLTASQSKNKIKTEANEKVETDRKLWADGFTRKLFATKLGIHGNIMYQEHAGVQRLERAGVEGDQEGGGREHPTRSDTSLYIIGSSLIHIVISFYIRYARGRRYLRC